MTPAINTAKKSKIWFAVHTYTHDQTVESYGEEATEKLAVAPQRVFKTLVVTNGNELIVGVVPVLQRLDLKLLAKAIGAKKIAMADVQKVERATGYIAGGISPLGQKKLLPTFIDASAQQEESIFVSAGRRGLEIELAPNDLLRLTKGQFAQIAK